MQKDVLQTVPQPQSQEKRGVLDGIPEHLTSMGNVLSNTSQMGSSAPCNVISDEQGLLEADL